MQVDKVYIYGDVDSHRCEFANQLKAVRARSHSESRPISFKATARPMSLMGYQDLQFIDTPMQDLGQPTGKLVGAVVIISDTEQANRETMRMMRQVHRLNPQGRYLITSFNKSQEELKEWSISHGHLQELQKWKKFKIISLEGSSHKEKKDIIDHLFIPSPEQYYDSPQQSYDSRPPGPSHMTHNFNMINKSSIIEKSDDEDEEEGSLRRLLYCLPWRKKKPKKNVRESLYTE